MLVVALLVVGEPPESLVLAIVELLVGYSAPAGLDEEAETGKVVVE